MTIKITPLRAIRLKQDKNLVDVARAVNIDTARLSRIERQEAGVSTVLAEKLAKYYKKKITELEILYPKRYLVSHKPRRNAG